MASYAVYSQSHQAHLITALHYVNITTSNKPLSLVRSKIINNGRPVHKIHGLLSRYM